MVDIPQTVQDWVGKWIVKQGLEGPGKLSLLAGDGSQRKFYRLKLKSSSYVVLHDAAWILTQDYAAHQSYLASFKLPVPHFITIDESAGCLVMEDLGDELLQVRVLEKGPDRKKFLDQAAQVIADMHRYAFPPSKMVPGANRRFDTEKYYTELLFTLEHLSQKLLNESVPSDELLHSLKRYCENLTQLQPDVLCHRDYHTRNLMLHDEKLYLIDFQDARLGPPHYDVASLIYDPYVPLSDPEKESILRTYERGLSGSEVGKKIAWHRFHADVQFMGFQRVVKAAGSYASFYTRYEKQTHLPYLKPALKTALELMPKSLEKIVPIENWLQKVKKLKIK